MQHKQTFLIIGVGKSNDWIFLKNLSLKGRVTMKIMEAIIVRMKREVKNANLSFIIALHVIVLRQSNACHAFLI